MSIKLLISVTRDQQIAVEQACLNEGKTLSEYFMSLHEKSLKKEMPDVSQIEVQNLPYVVKEPNLENDLVKSTSNAKKSKKSLN